MQLLSTKVLEKALLLPTPSASRKGGQAAGGIDRANAVNGGTTVVAVKVLSSVEETVFVFVTDFPP